MPNTITIRAALGGESICGIRRATKPATPRMLPIRWSWFIMPSTNETRPATTVNAAATLIRVWRCPSVLRVKWRVRGRGLVGACDTFTSRGDSDHPGERCATEAGACDWPGCRHKTFCPFRMERSVRRCQPLLVRLLTCAGFDDMRRSSCHGETVAPESEGGTA